MCSSLGRASVWVGPQYRGSTTRSLLRRLAPKNITTARWQHPYPGYFGFIFEQWEEAVASSILFTVYDQGSIKGIGHPLHLTFYLSDTFSQSRVKSQGLEVSGFHGRTFGTGDKHHTAAVFPTKMEHFLDSQ